MSGCGVTSAVRGVVMAMLGALAASSAARGGVARLPLLSIPLTGVPNDTCAADFNADGRQDLAATVPSAGVLVVLLQRPGGGYHPPRTVLVPDGPEFVRCADFDGDGTPDLVVSGEAPVQLLPGSGEGSFGPPTDLLANGGWLAVGDVNTDGRPDVLVQTGDQTRVLLNHGDGTFAEGAPVPYVGERFALADATGDAAPDLYMLQAGDGRIGILPGLGDGTFGDPVWTSLESRLRWNLATGDVDSDGRSDVAVARQDPNFAIAVLRTAEDLSLHELIRVATPHDGFRFPLRLVDLNGDSAVDLLGAEPRGWVIVALGHGDGTFEPAIEQHVRHGPPAGRGPRTIAVTDADGDSRLDLVLQGSRRLDVAFGVGDGRLLPVVLQSIGTLGEPTIATAQLNGDSFPDLLVADPFCMLETFFGRGDGTFDHGPNIVPDEATLDLTAGDFNDDGLTDVAQVGWLGVFELWWAQPDGSYTPGLNADLGFDTPQLTSGDIDADGHVDLAIAFQFNGNLSGLQLLFSRGDGGFDGQTRRLADAPAGVAIDDVNRDGHRDLIAAVPELDQIAVVYHLGNRVFDFPQYFDVGAAPLRVAVGDLNADAWPDLIAANRDSQDVSILYGRGDGTLAPELRVPLGREPVALAVGDLDGDGFDDAVVGTADELIAVIPGRDGSAPDETYWLATGKDVKDLVLADFDQDGRVDVATASNRSAVLIQLNASFFPGDLDRSGCVDSGDLTLLLSRFGTDNPDGDVDGDGDTDLGDLARLLANWGAGCR